MSISGVRKWLYYGPDPDGAREGDVFALDGGPTAGRMGLLREGPCGGGGGGGFLPGADRNKGWRAETEGYSNSTCARVQTRTASGRQESPCSATRASEQESGVGEEKQISRKARLGSDNTDLWWYGRTGADSVDPWEYNNSCRGWGGLGRAGRYQFRITLFLVFPLTGTPARFLVVLDAEGEMGDGVLASFDLDSLSLWRGRDGQGLD
ncbi:hypothetical protein FISHEDRAFT_62989 [Fistulina hepatica ATCC 64428]|uniref:Uncharacterized protein n=1 Tax=Fistulina hepatica ATCC 64428 TaxID=1128425 RepID=A0A0D7A258_9AGAR|nr:hypothetical protein FISHEDRAFT_62989 [Fistulina hepatica ATCC 64428]